MNRSSHFSQPIGARFLLLTGNAARLGFRGFSRVSDVGSPLSAQ
jgi:hypothetical protein